MKHTSFGDVGSGYKERKSSKIAILPVPYDKTSTWIKGADKGPLAILEASHQLETYDIETGREVYIRGIHTCDPVITDDKPEKMVSIVESKVKELLDEDKFVVTLGGEHSITAGAVKAHAAKFNNICVLQLDAHSDLRDEYEGSPYNHACVMARVREICPVVQVGVRSVAPEELDKIDPKSMFYARDIMSSGTWIEDIIAKLSENVYISVDLDVFDPSIMPSTGTPQPGGLDWYQVTGLLKAVREKKNVVGFDIMELCPSDTNKAPDMLAAKLVYKMLSYKFSDK